MSSVVGPVEAPTLDKKLDLVEAQKAVESLLKLKPPGDLQPEIEAIPMSAHYEANTDTNFEDKDAFVTGVARFLEEATEHAKLVSVLHGFLHI